MTLTEAEAALQAIQGRGVIEVLILSGEVHPQSTHRTGWFQRVVDLCELALSMGFLPHTNAGPLSFSEMAKLREVNVSMGLMLEQITPNLLKTVHRHAPSKVPALRLQQLTWAGELKIPFTTGLLLGIGETEAERWETLEAIAQIHQQWGHIQEVILQPHSPGKQQAWTGPAFKLENLSATVAMARQLLPPEVTLQVPPNLISEPGVLLACVEAGARDLGGIVPKDEVNPDYLHHADHHLATLLHQQGWQLAPRLPVYPQYDEWLSPPLQREVQRWRSQLPSATFVGYGIKSTGSQG